MLGNAPQVCVFRIDRDSKEAAALIVEQAAMGCSQRERCRGCGLGRRSHKQHKNGAPRSRIEGISVIARECFRPEPGRRLAERRWPRLPRHGRTGPQAGSEASAGVGSRRSLRPVRSTCQMLAFPELRSVRKNWMMRPLGDQLGASSCQLSVR